MNWFTQLWQYFFKKEKEEEHDPMKYLIVGLGNIGAEYDGTRHNIGFDVLDALAKEFEVKFKEVKLGSITEFRHKGRTFCLLKPSTYMNLSGKAVNYWMQKKKIEKNNLLVIVDDLHLELGKFRFRNKGSDGGHNGIKHINETIGGAYPRLRFGIGNDFHKGQQVQFVLGKWNDEELEQLPKFIKKAADAAKSFGTIGMARTMNQFNN